MKHEPRNAKTTTTSSEATITGLTIEQKTEQGRELIIRNGVVGEKEIEFVGES